MGALEAPQDRHGQEHRTGTSRAEQTDKGGHGGAGSSGGHGRWSLWPWPRSPRPGPYSRNPFTPPPPPTKFPWEVRGYQEPSGAKQTGQYMDSPPGLNTQEQDRTGQPSGAKQTGTGQDSPPGLNRQGQDRTATGTGALLGSFRKLRLPLGMTSQGPSQGPSATAFISATREAGGWNGLRGHKTRSRLPKTSLHEQDRHDD